MKIFWFIPTHGDSRYLGTSKGARQVDHAYMNQIAVAVDNLGYEGVLIPTGRSCEDPWLTAARRWTARTRTTPRSPSSATTLTTTSPSAACPRTARWPCFAAVSWKCWTPSWCCRWSLSRASRAWPKAASRCTWAGATPRARPTI